MHGRLSIGGYHGNRLRYMVHFSINTYILSTKRNAIFYLQFLGLKIIDFKSCFNSVVLPSNQDLDCRVSS